MSRTRMSYLEFIWWSLVKYLTSCFPGINIWEYFKCITNNNLLSSGLLSFFIAYVFSFSFTSSSSWQLQWSGGKIMRKCQQKYYQIHVWNINEKRFSFGYILRYWSIYSQQWNTEQECKRFVLVAKPVLRKLF